ncbi:glycosyltransferase family 2 protein [Patulibacter sp.]|uniref:glycosyltransferase family 2 protein n=1 Tax=Patulibacter sp. TaxID=1912859 RepID=UPI002716DC65|nr:glycosyltransferase family 2 protein [Patulibacter sp.]MDO9408797.1 glycosyltransferase family 2 protein [Patulibacter sp.]
MPPAARPAPSVSAVLVGYREDLDDLRRAFASLRAQSAGVPEIVYVDQREGDDWAARVRALEPAATIVGLGQNAGYVEACRAGVAAATGERIFFLNTDAAAAPDCLEQLAVCLDDDPTAALAGAQVLLPGGREVNAGDNPVHLSGIAWAGRWGEAPEDGPPREVASASGAAILVRREAFEALGGFTPGFFMYYDDVDFAWRAWLAGWRVLLVPMAVVEHDYVFEKGDYKWRWLERNRLWCVLAHFEARTLLLLAPLLLAIELAIVAGAVQGGWIRPKRAAYGELWRSRRALRERRAYVQATRVVGDATYLRLMHPALDSPVFPPAAARLTAPALRLYRWVVLRFVGKGTGRL